MMADLRSLCACCVLLLVTVGFGRANEASVADDTRNLTLDLGKGITMKLVLIPAGKFMMGSKLSPAAVVEKFGGKAERHTCEHPRREVTISKPFYMGIHEVTQAQWLTIMATEPWKDKVGVKAGDSHAASWMNSLEAIEFCKKLSTKTGRSIALPTEAQWEYACRAGTTTVFSYGDDPSKMGDYAWYFDNCRAGDEKEEYAHVVGQKKPNAWGLYDMHGNLWEFCRDWYAEDFYAKGPNVDPENTTETKHRAIRGGSWHNGSILGRCAGRNTWTGPKYIHYNYGFRVVVETGSRAQVSR